MDPALNCRTPGQRAAEWIYARGTLLVALALPLVGLAIDLLWLWSVEARLP
jgi:hypothetical protein